MAQERGACILRRHAAAVVGDPQEGHAAVPNLNGDFGCTGIHRVFQQLLDNGGRAFDDFTRGDQIGHVGG